MNSKKVKFFFNLPKRLFNFLLFGATIKELGGLIWIFMFIIWPIISVFVSISGFATIVDLYGDIYIFLYIPSFWILLWASPKSENGL